MPLGMTRHDEATAEVAVVRAWCLGHAGPSRLRVRACSRRFELVPVEQLGRPRIDVLCNMSGAGGVFACASRAQRGEIARAATATATATRAASTGLTSQAWLVLLHCG